ncbi:MAG: protein kinase domain-containing protein, partial [Polyangiales bacterium]
QLLDALVAGPATPPEALPWHAASHTRHSQYAALLRRLREELDRSAAELLELRYARELGPEEVACVLDKAPDAVLTELETAARQVTHLLQELPEPRPSLRALLIDAFALELTPPSVTQMRPSGHPGLELEPGTVLGERYAVEARVGRGAFADVYRAQDTLVANHWVALKLLHQPALSEVAKEDALREIEHIASVFHPSVVQFKAHGWHEGRLWFVMPWYQGQTLEARMADAPLSRAEALRIFEPLARALATMHRLGLRHQDIKPDNIFLARIFASNEGEEILPVLIDLGVSAKAAEILIAGTPTYFAPEVAAKFRGASAGHEPSDKADVFSLALSLRNALEPHSQESVKAGAVQAFIDHRATHMPALPAGRELRYLAPHLRRWLHPDPDARPSAAALVHELAVLTAPERRRARRSAVLRWLVPVGAAVAILFTAVVSVLHARAERERFEAAHARLVQADLRANLMTTEEERRTLAKSAKKLEKRYQDSQLTRKQLSSQLAQTQGKLGVSRARTRRKERERRQLSQDLERARSQLGDMVREIRMLTARRDVLQARLSEAQRRALTAEQDGQNLRRQLSRTQGELSQSQAARAATERRLSDERRHRAQVEAELRAADDQRRTLRAEVARLRAQLRQAQAAAAAAPAPVQGGAGGP